MCLARCPTGSVLGVGLPIFRFIRYALAMAATSWQVHWVRGSHLDAQGQQHSFEWKGLVSTSGAGWWQLREVLARERQAL